MSQTRLDDLKLDGTATIAESAYIGDTANAKATLGLTINQGANDDEILSLKSSDVSHGVTTNTEDDTYGAGSKFDPTEGGFRLTGYAEASTPGAALVGVNATPTNSRSTSAVAQVHLRGWAKSGTTLGSVGADKNLVVVQDGATTRFVHDSDGDFHADSSSTTF